MNLIPATPLRFPLILSPDDIAEPADDAERLQAWIAWSANGPSHDAVNAHDDGTFSVDVDVRDRSARHVITRAAVPSVELRGLGRRERMAAAERAGPVDILGEQLAQELDGGDRLATLLREDAEAIARRFVGQAIVREEGAPWRLVLTRDAAEATPGSDPHEALVRQMAYSLSLALRLPGLAARRLAGVLGADAAAELTIGRTEDDLSDDERAALARYRERGARYENELIRAGLAAFVVGGERFEGAAALDALDRVPVTAAAEVRSQILGHIRRMSLQGKVPPPSGRQSG